MHLIDSSDVQKIVCTRLSHCDGGMVGSAFQYLTRLESLGHQQFSGGFITDE